jgi:hypothetical protein
VKLYRKQTSREVLSVPADTTELKVTVPISDLSDFAAFLASLPRLEKLFLYTADLSKTDYTESLDFLRAAKQLKWLSIGSMEHLRDCDSITECRSLEFLSLHRRTTFEFEVLPSVMSLRRLSVEMPDSAAVEDIAKSAQITDLELRGGFNLSSLEPLSGLKGLEKLRLWSGRLDSSRGLAELEHLNSLDLGYSGLHDTTELGDGRRLGRLELIGNKKIRSLDFLRAGSLVSLGLEEVPALDSMKPLLRLSKLRQFKSGGTILDDDVSPLTQIPSLENASVHKKYGTPLKAIHVDSPCVFQAGHERFKLTKDGPLILETAADAKKRLLDKLAKKI